MAEFSATTATAQVFKELRADANKSTIARAFRACSLHAVTDFKANKRAADQMAHDTRLSQLAAMWCTFFKDAVVKPKDPTKETPVQKVVRLEAEVVTLRIELEAAKAALKAREKNRDRELVPA